MPLEAYRRRRGSLDAARFLIYAQAFGAALVPFVQGPQDQALGAIEKMIPRMINNGNRQAIPIAFKTFIASLFVVVASLAIVV